MNIPDPAILRKAIAIKTELEHLEQRLHELLLEASPKDSRMISKIIEKPLHTLTEEMAPTDKKEDEEKKYSSESANPQDIVGVLSSSGIDHENLLLVDDDGNEQLALISKEEANPSEVRPEPEFSLKESCYLPPESPDGSSVS
ncbi:MAG: hypothetical protein QE493_02250 [Verrucomicrobiae bacterium]|jgi:hypothetical protein|nr:hypothetical protein [Verrucomicrobiae bacterium]